LCFARQPYLGDATKNIKDRDNPFEEVKAIVQRDNDCKEFTDWQQGFTPKEHREILDRQRQLDFQVKREKEDKEWRNEQRLKDLEWREEQDKKAEGRHRVDLIVIGIIATIIIAVATILAAFIERGCLW
jgi:hypothetical protein